MGGWLSPSHSTYVKPKMKQTGGRYFPTAVRLHCVALAVEDSDWIMPGAWESLGPHDCWPDFGVVVANLQQEMAGCEAEHGPVTVSAAAWRCCGSRGSASPGGFPGGNPENDFPGVPPPPPDNFVIH